MGRIHTHNVNCKHGVGKENENKGFSTMAKNGKPCTRNTTDKMKSEIADMKKYLGTLRLLTEKDLKDWKNKDDKGSKGKWELISGVVDSGAVDTVTPGKTAKHIAVKPTEMSKRGMYYTTADGSPVTNEGEKFIEGFSDEGIPMAAPMQIANISRTLWSVRRMKEAGGLVAFGLSENMKIVDCNTGKTLCKGGEDVIVNKATGTKTKIQDTGKDYILNMWIKKPEAFTRQP